MSANDQVHSITGARPALRDDQAPRTRKYLISMAIRTACVLGAIVVPGWPRWILLAGAVVLPYLAVVIANAGRERPDNTPIKRCGLQRRLPAPTEPTNQALGAAAKAAHRKNKLINRIDIQSARNGLCLVL